MLSELCLCSLCKDIFPFIQDEEEMASECQNSVEEDVGLSIT